MTEINDLHVHVHVHIDPDQDVIDRLDRIEEAVTANTINEEILMLNTDELLAAVAENHDLDESIAAALDLNTQMLRDALAAQGLDQAVIDDVVAQVTAGNDVTREAIQRNTVADPTTPTEPAAPTGDTGTDVDGF